MQAIQSRQPRSHTIIEAHPDVHRRMLQEGWHEKPGVTIIFARWQDCMDKLTDYDGIFFDTFSEHYEDLRCRAQKPDLRVSHHDLQAYQKQHPLPCHAALPSSGSWKAGPVMQ